MQRAYAYQLDTRWSTKMKLLVSKYKTHDIVGHVPDFLTEEEMIVYKINEICLGNFAGTRYSGYNTKDKTL